MSDQFSGSKRVKRELRVKAFDTNSQNFREIGSELLESQQI